MENFSNPKMQAICALTIDNKSFHEVSLKSSQKLLRIRVDVEFEQYVWAVFIKGLQLWKKSSKQNMKAICASIVILKEPLQFRGRLIVAVNSRVHEVCAIDGGSIP